MYDSLDKKKKLGYKFPVEKCGNCGLKLKVDENVGMEQRPQRVIGYCPKCFVIYTMEEV